MTPLSALLWDVDGTLAESERDGHLVAFNLAFEAMGLPWRWDEARYGRLLHISGGRERLLHDMFGRSDAPVLGAEREALARALHRHKNAFYAERVAAGHVPLRPGVAALIAQCAARGLHQAIVTTTGRANLDALLASAFGAGAAPFDVVVCGEDVARKKPDPEVYLKALAALRIGPLQVVALEDSPGGVAAARAAGVPVVVPRSHFFADAVIEEAIALGPGLHTRAGWRPALAGEGAVTLEDIEYWRQRSERVSQFG